VAQGRPSAVSAHRVPVDLKRPQGFFANTLSGRRGWRQRQASTDGLPAVLQWMQMCRGADDVSTVRIPALRLSAKLHLQPAEPKAVQPRVCRMMLVQILRGTQASGGVSSELRRI
jgi:hypothetical protein